MKQQKTIRIEQIVMDAACQMRPGLDNDIVQQYAADMRKGDQFPPVKAVYDPAADRYWLTDGYHTINACLMIGRSEHPAIVTEGSRRDAILQAVGANPAHGLRRCAQTKRNAVRQLLLDPEWSQWSLRAIAEAASVSVGLVSKVKGEMEEAGEIKRPQMVMFERNGRTMQMDIAAIGSGSNANSHGPDPAHRPETAVSGPMTIGPIAIGPTDVGPTSRPASNGASGSQAVSIADQTNSIIVGDCLDIMAQLPDGRFTLIVTSPPYPRYRGMDLDVDQWLAWFEPRLAQMSRVLSAETGILAINVNFPRQPAEDGSVIWTDERLYTQLLPMALSNGFHLLHIIPWVKPNPPITGHIKRTDHEGWEPVFVFARSSQYVYQPYHRPYQPKTLHRLAGEHGARGAGLNGGYSGQLDRIKATGARQPNVIIASPSGGGQRPRAKHGSFPRAIPHRLISQYSQVGDWVMDPFAGAGTTLVEAAAQNRLFVGIDNDPDEVAKAQGWLSELGLD